MVIEKSQSKDVRLLRKQKLTFLKKIINPVPETQNVSTLSNTNWSSRIIIRFWETAHLPLP